MLDQIALGESINRTVEKVPCHVPVTAELVARYAAEGTAPTMPHDERRFARARLPFPNYRAAILFRNVYPALQRDDQWHGAYLTNVSRGGFQLLYHEQLYPGEKLCVVAANGKTANVSVVRCRRVAEKCFEIGVRFFAQPNAS